MNDNKVHVTVSYTRKIIFDLIKKEKISRNFELCVGLENVKS